MSLELELRTYILREHLAGEDPSSLSNDDDLIENGVLDSLAVMQLVAHLEKTYKIEVAPAEIAPENLRSVQTLASFVRGKQG